MKGNRMGRVQEEVRREIGEILGRRARDPRLQWISVTRVLVSRDLAVAKVFVSVLGTEDVQEEALRALVKAGPFLRTELGRRLRLRRTPELRFIHDQGIEHSLRISRLLDELGVERSDPAAGPGALSDEDGEGGADGDGAGEDEDLR